MPRGPRLDVPNCLHHVIARGIERRSIFRSDIGRQDFLNRLADKTADGGAPRHEIEPVEVAGHSLRRATVTARAELCHRAVREYGFTLAEVGRALGVSKQSVLRGVRLGERLQRRIEGRFENSGQCARPGS